MLVLYQGAAVEDGRLKPGDRLLEVNGIEMTGKSQAEAVAVLRNAPPGSRVKIVVSRQEESTGPTLPREIVSEAYASSFNNSLCMCTNCFIAFCTNVLLRTERNAFNLNNLYSVK